MENFKDKYLKYKNKYLKYGGKINLHVNPVYMNIFVSIESETIELIYNKLLNNKEYCGKFIFKQNYDNLYILKGLEIIEGPEINAQNERGTCTNHEEKLYAVIWHTHPYISKYYPSVEDLIKVKKIRAHGQPISLSFIFTSIGIWIFNSSGNNIDKDDPNEKSYKEDIAKSNTTLYNSLKVRKYTNGTFDDYRNLIMNDEDINMALTQYIDEIKKLNFNIILYKWKDIQYYKFANYDSYFNLPLLNVRSDALLE
jgi:hypothetical protein